MDNNAIEMPIPSIEYWENNNNLVELKSFKRQYENNSTHTLDQEKLYKKICSKIEELEKKELEEVLNEERKDNSILDKFQIITIHEEEKSSNDRDVYDTKMDSYYLKCDNIVYEIEKENVDKVKIIIGDKEKLKNLNEQQIIDLLHEYLTPVEEKSIEIGKEQSVKEIETQIDNFDSDIKKKTTIKDLEDINKEREILTEYVRLNNLVDIELKMTINSRGERLYLLGDRAIKFLGEEKSMHFYTKDGEEIVKSQVDETIDLNNNFNYNINNNIVKNKDIVNNNIKNRSVEEVNAAYDINYFKNYISNLNGILQKIYNGIKLEEKEESFLRTFVQIYINSINQGLFIDSEVIDFYESMKSSFKENYYPYDEINNLFNSQVNKENQNKEETLENKNEINDVKKLTLNNTYADKGFVNILYIVLSILVTCSVIVYLFLINK